MGGSGGGGWDTLGDIGSLERKAKEALKGGKRNVFISFAMEDRNEVELLRGQAKNEGSDLEFNDHSVREEFNSERAAYIRQKIEERISRASATVVYVSDSTSQSHWVKWEVDKSVELGKKVIAVHAAGKKPKRMPPWIRHHGIKVVPWSKLARELE